jgi:hypothetical protein
MPQRVKKAKSYTGPVVYVDGQPFGIAERWSSAVNLSGQATQRWSQSGLPAAQFPVKMRRLYAIPPGHEWLQFDLSNAEARIVGAITSDEVFVNAFTLDWDMHLITACELFDIPLPPSLVKSDIWDNPDAAMTAWKKAHNFLNDKDPRRSFAKVATYKCVPEFTQALTRNGWRLRDELTIGEDILAYNPLTGYKEWTPLLDIVRYTSAPVVRMENKHGFKFDSTAEHRWYVRQRRDSGSGLYMVDQVRATQDITPYSNIITNAAMWPDYTTDSLELPFTKTDDSLVEAVCQMSHAQRIAWLHGFMLADGCIKRGKNGENRNWTWCQNLGPIAEAALTASYFTHTGHIFSTINRCHKNPMILCSLSTLGHVTGQRLVRTDMGSQEVWCPVTELGTWVARQGRTITITGNSLYRGQPKTAYKIPGAGKTGFSREELEAAMWRWLSQHPKLTGWWDQVAMEIQRTSMVRSAAGQRRVLTNADHEANVRAGCNFPIQSLVAYWVDRIVVEIAAEEPRAILQTQCHDSLAYSYPIEIADEVRPKIQEISNRERTLGGLHFRLPADFDKPRRNA